MFFRREAILRCDSILRAAGTECSSLLVSCSPAYFVINRCSKFFRYSYSGNLTINANAPTTSGGVTSAINSCLAAVPSSGTFVPSLVAASPASTAKATGSAAAAAASASGSAAAKAASGVRGNALEWTALVVAGALAVVV